MIIEELINILNQHPKEAIVRIFGKELTTEDVTFEIIPEKQEDVYGQNDSIEVWKDIRGYEDRYQISNQGRVKSKARIEPHSDGKISHHREKVMIPQINKLGYKRINLTNGSKVRNFMIHRLVAEAFVDNPFNYNCVDHIDGNKTNNHRHNLRWVTQQVNCNNPVSKRRYAATCRTNLTGKNNVEN